MQHPNVWLKIKSQLNYFLQVAAPLEAALWLPLALQPLYRTYNHYFQYLS
jgi:hypothetical protein